jgi:hypothetical protein
MNAQTDKYAADMVAQQVAAYDRELKDLEERAQQIQVRKHAILLMRSALLPLTKGRVAPINTEIQVGTGTLTLQGGNGTAATTPPKGFADAVRQILRDHPKGLAPSDVADQMKVRGTDKLYSGNTPFKTRVGNELHRLLKADELIRQSGRYVLKQQELRQ